MNTCGWRRIAGNLVLLAALLAIPPLAAAETQSLVILHNNDIHGHLRSFCYTEVGKGPIERCGVGGAAKRATLIRTLRAKADAPVLLIDAGDTTTRGPLATEYEGIDQVEVMNAIGYDMAAIGNNEFKLKDSLDAEDAAGAQASLMRLIRRSNFPWLCANATDAQGALLPGVQPFVVRKVGNLRIAFLGLTAPRSKSYPQTRGLVIGDPVEAAKIWIPRARAEADVVIAVTHIGVLDDRRLVRETRGLDAIVGGDSHTFLYAPITEKNLDGVSVPIVQDGEFGVNLGEYRLTFEGDAAAGWRLTAFTDRLIPVGANLRADRAIAAIVESYARPLDIDVGALGAVGATPAERIRLTAEALATAWKASAGTEVGLQTEGSLFEVFRDRKVTRYVVRAVLPFHDSVWRGEVTGAKLKALLENPAPAIGAIRATLDPGQIDPARTYSVAAVGFTAQALIAGAVDTGAEARKAAETWLGSTAR